MQHDPARREGQGLWRSSPAWNGSGPAKKPPTRSGLAAEKVAAWGSGGKGQLGNGEGEDSASPVERCSNRPPRWSKSWAAHSTRWRGWPTANCTPGAPTARVSSASKPDPKRAKAAVTPEMQHGARTGSRELKHVVAVAAAGEGTSFAVEEEENAAKVIYSFGGRRASSNCSASGTSVHEHRHSHPDRRHLGPVRGDRREHHHRRGDPRKRLGASAPDRAQRPSKKRSRPNGTCRRTVQAARPAGGHQGIRQNPGRELQKPLQPAAHGPQSAALRGDPQEPRRQRRPGRTSARSSARRSPGKAGRPNTVAAHHQRQPPRSKPGNCASARRSPSRRGAWTNSPTQFSYQWLRCEGNGEAGAAEELGDRMRTDHGRQRTGHRRNL